MKNRNNYTCPLELTHDVTKGKWKPLILWFLGKKVYSLSELSSEISDISMKMLIQHLSELMECGMISKKSFEGYPLKVEYSITDRGKKMLAAIGIMQEIGIEMMKEDGQTELLKQLGFL